MASFEGHYYGESIVAKPFEAIWSLGNHLGGRNEVVGCASEIEDDCKLKLSTMMGLPLICHYEWICNFVQGMNSGHQFDLWMSGVSIPCDYVCPYRDGGDVDHREITPINDLILYQLLRHCP
ncbi:Uncharacterized protein TCM_043841 [Theobroma cacao]|uniref:Uncharacterized protein n=1 Tax=Theobroma cacao TaxID=3641 RepID=A0A061FP61_THECC|nr:Uncharacterized protein TCM_043841 [Theobroma cacao]